MQTTRSYDRLKVMTNRLLVITIVVLLVIGTVLLLTNKASKNASQTIPKTPQDQNQQTKNAGKPITQATVTVTETGFLPASLTVKAGTKVVWRNISGKIVAVQSAEHPTHLLYPPLNLGEFPNGASVQLVFDKLGKYRYHNHLIPNQTGEVIVE